MLTSSCCRSTTSSKMFQARTWNAPSPEEEKIFALETQIQKLQKEKKKPKQANKKGREKEGSKKTKGKKKKDLPKWMKIPLAKADKDKPKPVKGKEYLWCARHARWGRHLTPACKGMGLNKDPKTNQEPPALPQAMAQLGLSRALSTIVLSDSK